MLERSVILSGYIVDVKMMYCLGRVLLIGVKGSELLKLYKIITDVLNLGPLSE